MARRQYPNRPANRRLAGAASLIGATALLAGCAGMAGPPVHTDMTGEHAYRIYGAYTSVSDSAGVLKKQMKKEADEKCPAGWKLDAAGPNNTASSGGQVWQIHCTGVAPAPMAQAPRAYAPPAAATAMPAAPAKNQEAVLRVMTAAALGAAPELSTRAARAIAEAQLRSLEAAGVTLTDTKGQNLAPKGK